MSTLSTYSKTFGTNSILTVVWLVNYCNHICVQITDSLKANSRIIPENSAHSKFSQLTTTQAKFSHLLLRRQVMNLVFGGFIKILAEFHSGWYWFSNLTAICEPTVYKMWQPRRPTTLWVPTACYRDNFIFSFCWLRKTYFTWSSNQNLPIFWSEKYTQSVTILARYLSFRYL
jgi:hypothetical protein